MRADIELVIRIIEWTGIAAIAGGAAVATVWFALTLRRMGFDSAYRGYRQRLGQAILLGLELLVAADIIGTVAIDPTLRSVAVLGGIVLIRTFLSFALEVEIEGQWPWRRWQKTELSRGA